MDGPYAYNSDVHNSDVHNSDSYNNEMYNGETHMNQTQYSMAETIFPELTMIFMISYTTCMIFRACKCYRDNNSNSNSNSNSNTNNERLIPEKKIKKEVILYTEDFSDQECSICLEEFKINEELIKIDCNHYFHSQCINDWIKFNGSCPLCRLNLL